MNVKASLLVITIATFLSCTKHDDKNKLYYKAINNQDTAYLSINRLENKFYGQLEIRYGGQGVKDSGAVSGLIKADSLRGNFNFAPYGGGEYQRKPIIFLEKDGKLILGKGATYTLFKITYFRKDVPLDFSRPEFVFEEKKISRKRN